MQHEGSVPGEPADASEADREVKVIASDELRFDPSSIDVSAGEVITFVIRNVGQTEHEFVLGDAAYQEMHEKDMAEGDHHMTGEPHRSPCGRDRGDVCSDTEQVTQPFQELDLHGFDDPFVEFSEDLDPPERRWSWIR